MGQIQRRLPAVLDYYTMEFGAELTANTQDVFQGQRFEEQKIRSVVVGADRFRVGVDHYRFESQFLHREGSMHAAVIELNALAHPVRAATENYDFLLVADANLVIDHSRALFALNFYRRGFIGGIVIRRIGFELSRTGVYQFIYRFDSQFTSAFSQFLFGRLIDVS